jgi:hypothetical protein
VGSYVNQVSEKLTKWESSQQRLPDQRDFQDLLLALEIYCGSTEAQVADSGEDLTKEVLLRVFGKVCANGGVNDCASINELGLFERLLINNRWRALFKTAETASAFVIMVMMSVETRSRVRKTEASAVQLKFAEAVREWLPPGVELQETTLRDIAVALFGEPWCNLVGDSRSAHVLLSEAIIDTRPEFLPGRLTAVPTPAAMPLPNMMFPE